MCKESYSGYEFHVSDEKHREKLSSSPFNEYIDELIEVYLPAIEMNRLYLSSQNEE